MTEIFVGPYVKILRDEAQIQRSFDVTFNGCTNPECELHSIAKNIYSNFCPECGHKVEADQQVNKPQSCLLNVAFRGAGLEPLEYAGSGGRYLYLDMVGARRRDSFYDSGFGALDLSIFDKEEEIQWLQKELAEYLKVIDKEFGEGFYSIQWGIVDLS